MPKQFITFFAHLFIKWLLINALFVCSICSSLVTILCVTFLFGLTECCSFVGNLFHIDFGYILGRDPKPLPPPMKLSKEMVMDGKQ